MSYSMNSVFIISFLSFFWMSNFKQALTKASWLSKTRLKVASGNASLFFLKLPAIDFLHTSVLLFMEICVFFVWRGNARTVGTANQLHAWFISRCDFSQI